ncbi:hypothetical protein EVAR_6810_1 [Eumeta japonica]|uniref:Uncharacterized protein n=1 Tax=Eumeta variegata TaxID=151549 RepID=A0A4C1U6C7_EUMVA|nr:hypothetical protein EVAR_6810_1 [Eumeta japonica]
MILDADELCKMVRSFCLVVISSKVVTEGQRENKQLMDIRWRRSGVEKPRCDPPCATRAQRERPRTHACVRGLHVAGGPSVDTLVSTAAFTAERRVIPSIKALFSGPLLVKEEPTESLLCYYIINVSRDQDLDQNQISSDEESEDAAFIDDCVLDSASTVNVGYIQNIQRALKEIRA